MVVMIVLGLLVIFGIAVAYFSARTWSVLNVALVVAVFLVSLVLVILGAATLKTQDKWRSEYEKTKKEVQAAKDEAERLLYGDPDNSGQSADTLPDLQGELERAALDRGRVWRGVRPSIQQGQIVVDMRGFGDAKCVRVGLQDDEDLEPQADPEAQEPDTPHGITANMVLYAFQEQSLVDLGQGEAGAARLKVLFPESDLPTSDTEGVCRLPSYFLGQFRAAQVVDQTVTLVPALPLDAEQVERIKAAAGTTWTLHEILPVDRHDVFAGLNAEQLQAILPQQAFGLDNDQYAALIQEYARDGSEASEADERDRVETWVKFVQDYDKIEVDAEVDETGQAGVVDRDFDSSGLAVSPLLRQQNVDPDAGSRVLFAVGDAALFDSETAARLVEQGICEADPRGSVYRRRLRDYGYIFRQASLQSRQLEQEQARVQRQTEAVQSAALETAKQIEYRRVEKGKVEQDLNGWKQEVAQLGQLASALQDQDEQMRKRLSYLYRKNSQLLAELTALQSRLKGVLGDGGGL
jgi:hypothetical protein